jgi:hypothetical protein
MLSFHCEERQTLSHTRQYHCSQCPFVADELCDFRQHWQSTHINNLWRRAVITNQCPWCLQTFVSRRVAQEHVSRQRQRNGQCTRTRARLQCELIEVVNPCCPFCEFHGPLGVLQSHICNHFEQEGTGDGDSDSSDSSDSSSTDSSSTTE